MSTTEENKDEKKEAIKRTKRLEARVTKKEYAKAVELAETCGLTLSDYIRKCALGSIRGGGLPTKRWKPFAVSPMHGAN